MPISYVTTSHSTPKAVLEKLLFYMNAFKSHWSPAKDVGEKFKTMNLQSIKYISVFLMKNNILK